MSGVDQDVLFKLADHIGLPWKRVGLHLGLHNAELEQVEMDNSYSWDKVYCMLNRWFQNYTGDVESKASTLRKALIDSGLRIENPHTLQELVNIQS